MKCTLYAYQSRGSSAVLTLMGKTEGFLFECASIVPFLLASLRRLRRSCLTLYVAFRIGCAKSPKYGSRWGWLIKKLVGRADTSHVLPAYSFDCVLTSERNADMRRRGIRISLRTDFLIGIKLKGSFPIRVMEVNM